MNNRTEKLQFITDQLNANKTIQLTTFYKSIVCRKKHLDLFKLTENGLYIKMGKKYQCIDGCKISAY